MGVMNFRKRHLAEMAKRKEHQQPARHARPVDSSVDAIYLTHRDQCRADWKSLKAITDHAVRDQRKPKLLDNYRDYLAGVIDEGKTATNEVLLRNIVWAADMRDWDWLLTMADFAVDTGQDMTLIGFKSGVATFVSDAVRDFADQYYKDTQAKKTGEELVPFEMPKVFAEVMARLDGWEVNFVSVAKYHKLAGLEAESNRQWDKAVEHYTAANAYPNVGVKTRLVNAEKQLNLGH